MIRLIKLFLLLFIATTLSASSIKLNEYHFTKNKDYVNFYPIGFSQGLFYYAERRYSEGEGDYSYTVYQYNLNKQTTKNMSLKNQQTLAELEENLVLFTKENNISISSNYKYYSISSFESKNNTTIILKNLNTTQDDYGVTYTHTNIMINKSKFYKVTLGSFGQHKQFNLKLSSVMEINSLNFLLLEFSNQEDSKATIFQDFKLIYIPKKIKK